MERGKLKSMLVVIAACASGSIASRADSECSRQTAPMQAHLAYAGDHGMTVSWNTHSKLHQPYVRYGHHAEALDQWAHSDISVTYPTSTTYNNHVKIIGLQPDTLYYYQPQCGNSSQIYTMKTSRAAGDHTPFTIAVGGDMGYMGPKGLTTTTGPNGGNAPLGMNDNNTIQSLQSMKSEWEFYWHRMFSSFDPWWISIHKADSICF